MWSTDLAVMRCVRCGGFVLAGLCGGVPVAVDPGALDVEAYRRALLAGRGTYRLVRKPSGAPWRLQDDSSAWSSQLERLGAHGCLNAPLEAVGVEVPDPTRAAVGTADGSTPPPAPASRLGNTNVTNTGVTNERSYEHPDRKGHMGDSDAAGGDSGCRRDHPWLARYCARCHESIGFECREGIKRGEYWDWVKHARC